ncbi:related to O-methyltransferase B [Phialocephala subalpina]|uniref:Related to O-methyltransferase B n=1 Tax=Phialocephala subalpina TaxID=576137 RepID=A0A1L7XQU9_9HELO|nr:related to O-methyltransferase B [Phialocephala subalpina]
MSDAVSKALEEAEKLVAALKGLKANPSPTEHLAILKHTDKIRLTLEEPYDLVTRWLENMAVASALYTLIQIGAFEKLPAEGSISAQTLATEVKVDLSVITRTMRVILTSGIAVETASDEYAHNMLSMVLQPQALGGFFLVCMDFQRTEGGLTYYEVLNEDEGQRKIWNNTMQQMEKNMPILGIFPFATLKEQVEKEPERPFIVDIGSGKGQAMLAIETECPKFFGAKVILQDLPIVINSLKPEDIPGITPTTHDIFTPQPVKNAHVYFMRRLLHDFYIPVCLDILKNVVPAMGPDSRLIICDMLIPERVEIGGPMELYWLDFSLMMISGREKTLKEFNDMFEEVGLELVKVYPSAVGKTAMLETRLKKA